jgi:hypothetical protein
MTLIWLLLKLRSFKLTNGNQAYWFDSVLRLSKLIAINRLHDRFSLSSAGL